MYRTLLGRVGVASVGFAALLWVACATIPDFIVTGGAPTDATSPNADGGFVDSGPPFDGDFERDGGKKQCADASPPSKYVMFVTAVPLAGDFAQGKPDVSNAADGICATRGAKIDSCTPWKALLTTEVLSDGDGGTTINAFDRVVIPPGGLYQVTGSGAPGTQLFTPGSLKLQQVRPAGAPPILDENGQVPTSNVWFGTTAAEENCNLWRDSAKNAIVGKPTGTGIDWFSGGDGPRACTEQAALYCVQQPP